MQSDKTVSPAGRYSSYTPACYAFEGKAPAWSHSIVACCAALLTCSAPGQSSSWHELLPSHITPDLTSQCDATLQNTSSVPVQITERTFRPEQSLIVREGDPLASVVSVSWDPHSGHLLVLDGVAKRLRRFDGTLREIHRSTGLDSAFASIGELPRRAGRSVIAALANETFAIRDLQTLHILTINGRVVARAQLDGIGGAREIGTFGPTSVLIGMDGSVRMDEPNWDNRSGVVLAAGTLQGERIDFTSLGTVRNYLALRPPPGAVAHPDAVFPYSRFFGRYFASDPSGILAVPSHRLAGVCFFDTTGSIIRAHRVNAPVVIVDQTERDSILGQRAHEIVPHRNLTWAEYYRDLWPDQAPSYVGIHFAPDSTAWVERLLPWGRRIVDRIHLLRGYRGSHREFDTGTLLTFMGPCAVLLEETGRSPVVRRWCPEQPDG